MVGKSLVTAWLESSGIAAQSRVEVVNGSKDTVCVLASASIVDIDWKFDE